MLITFGRKTTRFRYFRVIWGKNTVFRPFYANIDVIICGKMRTEMCSQENYTHFYEDGKM